jgi:hypothetical protein
MNVGNLGTARACDETNEIRTEAPGNGSLVELGADFEELIVLAVMDRDVRHVGPKQFCHIGLLAARVYHPFVVCYQFAVPREPNFWSHRDVG